MQKQQNNIAICIFLLHSYSFRTTQPFQSCIKVSSACFSEPVHITLLIHTYRPRHFSVCLYYVVIDTVVGLSICRNFTNPSRLLAALLLSLWMVLKTQEQTECTAGRPNVLENFTQRSIQQIIYLETFFTIKLPQECGISCILISCWLQVMYVCSIQRSSLFVLNSHFNKRLFYKLKAYCGHF